MANQISLQSQHLYSPSPNSNDNWQYNKHSILHAVCSRQWSSHSSWSRS